MTVSTKGQPVNILNSVGRLVFLNTSYKDLRMSEPYLPSFYFLCCCHLLFLLFYTVNITLDLFTIYLFHCSSFLSASACFRLKNFTVPLKVCSCWRWTLVFVYLKMSILCPHLSLYKLLGWQLVSFSLHYEDPLPLSSNFHFFCKGNCHGLTPLRVICPQWFFNLWLSNFRRFWKSLSHSLKYSFWSILSPFLWDSDLDARLLMVSLLSVPHPFCPRFCASMWIFASDRPSCSLMLCAAVINLLLLYFSILEFPVSTFLPKFPILHLIFWAYYSMLS